jgi:uncharacterized protein involved in exopolysaccharide biosynthesis
MSKPVLTPSQPQAFEEPDTLPGNEFGFLDVLIVIARNLRLLILAPIVAGLLGFGIAYVWPPKYASVAYLTFPVEPEKQTDAFKDAFKSAEALMRSPTVLDVVLKQYPQLGSPDRQRRELDRRIVWAAARGSDRKTPNVVVVSIEDDSPERARAINIALLEAWLEETKPKPDRRARLEAQLMRTEGQLKAVSDLFDRLTGETPKLVLPGMQNELASSLSGLLSQRAIHIANIEALKLALAGVSRDVIVVPPTLPDEPSWPKKTLVAASAAAGTVLVLLLFLFCRQAWNVGEASPQTRKKLAQIASALRRRRAGT